MEFIVPELTFFVFGLLTGALVSWFFQFIFDKKNTFKEEDLLLEQAKLTRENEKLQEELEDQKATFQYENKLLKSQKPNVQEYKTKIAQLESNLDIANQLLKEENQRAKEAENKLVSNNTEQPKKEKLLKQQKEEIASLRKAFKQDFEEIANRIVTEKIQNTTPQQNPNLAALLEPLNKNIKAFEAEIRKQHQKESEQRASIIEQFHQLTALNQQLNKETKNLTKVLKNEGRVRGNWGEMILEKILEKSGLVKGREYQTLKPLNNLNGKTNRHLQPDVLINLPDDRHIIIDSKVPLSAYERYNIAEDPTPQLLKEHLLSIGKHIKALNQQNYQNLYQLQTLDFVLLFIPIEGAFSLAIQQDPDLFNTAFEENIILVSPTTLLATLRTVANIWRQEQQMKNAIEISKQSGLLYDKFVSFTQDLEEVGRSLLQTERSYEAAMQKLCVGKGNLITSADHIKQLGAKASKEIPQNLKDENYLIEHESEE